MRTFKHWSPRYIKNRILEFCYYKFNPNHPWLTKTANQILASYLSKTDVGLEFGSGRSTIWFAKNVGHLTSVEHNEVWYNEVRSILNDEQIDNVDYYLKPRDELTKDKHSYVAATDNFEINSLDFVLIDGIYRGQCTLSVLNLISPGGILVIDNINRYLPSNSYSPSSRTFKQGPLNSDWHTIQNQIKGWRSIWTSSGVTDTAFFIKPCIQHID